MEVLHDRCAGLDVHKRLVTACRIVGGQREVRIVGTMTDDLLRLRDWLAEAGVSHVAMESTGVYWKPVYNVLEGHFELLVVNAQHIKAVPGRKTDIRDCEWIADLLRHGLVRASFVPDQQQRELRDLTRYRTALVRERSAEVNRLQKTLEGANIKLAAVAANVMGVSARAMLAALVAGSVDAETMADLARGQLRAKIPELQRALSGRVGSHQRFLLAVQLAHIDFLDGEIERLDREVEERTRPFEDAIQRLDAVPGVGRKTAEVLVAEIGVDMSRFPTADHLASWAGVCPGNNESAGKRRSGKTRKGSPWLRAALTEAGRAAARTKHTYLSARYHRLVVRRGSKKAAIAVAHTILVTAYHLLNDPSSGYHDLGGGYFDQRDHDRLRHRLLHRLEGLGYDVVLKPTAA